MQVVSKKFDYKSVVVAGYNKCGVEYDLHKEGGLECSIDYLFNTLPDKAKVLDVGCGAGRPVASLLSKKFDVLVVGSGITGGWAAKEFCERGFDTLMIERGRVVEHRKDYIGEGKPVWDFDNRMKVDNLLIQQQHQIQKDCYAFHDGTKHFFGNDRDLPYDTAKGTDFRWIRANQLGGKSLLWHRQSYRMCPDDFLANKRDGHGNDWPIR